MSNSTNGTSSGTIQTYCVKCKTKRDLINPQAVYTATGTPGTRGTCPVCGTTLFRMGATPAHASVPKPEAVEKPKRASTRTAAKKPAKRATAASRTGTGAKSTSARSANGRRGAAKKTGGRSKSSAKSSTQTALRVPGKVGKLVIVESPAKARSVGQFLGRGYTVRASKGHVRDLLVSTLSVDVKNDFEPTYRVMNDKRDVVKELKSYAQSADEIYLATDPDREGEAIAWHLLHAAEIDPKKTRRVEFHEITGPAIQDAFGHPREIDMDLVNAQQARRILDRLVGYQVSELLWDKVRNRLSAGRVQSIAVRLIVDREREIEAFVPREYWTLDAKLRKHIRKTKADQQMFVARLMKIAGRDADLKVEGDVTPHLPILQKSVYTVADVKRGERLRKPMPPFTTSTLQQEASRRLGFNARRTMSVAQQLYEGIDVGADGSVGLITYMRTDSLNVSPQAQSEARDFVTKRYGKNFIPPKAPQYRTKSKGAQEAHEAIRPTSVMREPDAIRKALTSDQFRLYQLIWQRFVASQMASAVYDTLRVDIDARQPNDTRRAGPAPYELRVSGSTIRFNGFLALYEESRDEDAAKDEDEGRILPELTPGDLLDLLDLLPEQHFTQPPPRYTEATLVKALEELGIGRPSTYAPTVAVIQDREYVTKDAKRLVPTEIGKIVNDLLTKYFSDIMDYNFTAKLEDQLDTIAEGDIEWRPMLGGFYGPFERQLDNARKTAPSMQQTEEVGRDCPVCGKPLVIRYGRFGKFIGCSDYPNCKHTEPLLERMGIPCPQCGPAHGGEMTIRRSRAGKTFFGCSRYPDCDYVSWKRPLRAPCPNCGGMLVEASRKTAQCIRCERKYPIAELPAEQEAEPASA